VPWGICCLYYIQQTLFRWPLNIVLTVICLPTIRSWAVDVGHAIACYAMQFTSSQNVGLCRRRVRIWMRSNRLQLNGDKTQFLWCASPRRRHHVPSGGVQLGPDQVQPVQSARDLGVYIGLDDSMAMKTHTNNVLSSCYGSLSQIRSIKRSLPVHALNTLVTSYTVDCTTATSCSQDCQPATSNAPNPSPMPPYDWSRTHQDQTTSHHCFASVTGCPSRNVSTTSCAWWFIVACMNERAPWSILSDEARHSRAGLRSAESRTVSVLRTLSSLGDRAFAVAAPRAWNSLPFADSQSTLLTVSRKISENICLNIAFNLWCFAYGCSGC